jgi:hypothetical protein
VVQGRAWQGRIEVETGVVGTGVVGTGGPPVRACLKSHTLLICLS